MQNGGIIRVQDLSDYPFARKNDKKTKKLENLPVYDIIKKYSALLLKRNKEFAIQIKYSEITYDKKGVERLTRGFFDRHGGRYVFARKIARV